MSDWQSEARATPRKERVPWPRRLTGLRGLLAPQAGGILPWWPQGAAHLLRSWARSWNNVHSQAPPRRRRRGGSVGVRVATRVQDRTSGSLKEHGLARGRPKGGYSGHLSIVRCPANQSVEAKGAVVDEEARLLCTSGAVGVQAQHAHSENSSFVVGRPGSWHCRDEWLPRLCGR